MDNSSKGPKPPRLVLRQFALTFIIGAASLSTAFVLVAYHSFELEQEKFQNTESLRLELTSKEIARTLERVVIDIRELSQSDIVTDYLRLIDQTSRARLEHEFAIVMNATGMYDQIRFIDNTGFEKVRVNANHNDPIIVKESQLQDKSDRYYFRETIKLAPDQIYISALDLNRDNGVIERPFKPVIRFATPLFRENETHPAGILAVNYLASDLLSQYEDMMKNSWGQAMLLDQQGYWLYAPDHQDEWGFDLNNNKTFGKRFPLTWEQISNRSSGTITNDEGVFNLETIQPAQIVGNNQVSKATPVQNWKLVSWVSPELTRFSIWSALKQNFRVSVALLLLTALISFVIAWLRTANIAKSMALTVNESRYRNLFENMADGYALQEAIFDAQGKPYDYRYLEVNSAFERLLGFKRRQVIGKTVLQLLPGTEKHWLDTFAHVATTGKPARLEQYGGSFGRYFEIAATSPGYGLVAVIFSDVTERKQVEQQLRQAATVFDNTMEAIMIADADRVVVSVNQAFTEVTGFSPEDALGKTLEFQKSIQHDDTFYRELWRSLSERGQWQGEIWNRRKNGEPYPAWENITTVLDEQKTITHYISVFSDISAIKQAEKQLSHMAHHDALTGLANRLVFTANLEQAIERAQRHRQKVALLFLDLDRFKVINDTLGHAAGDKLLQVVADRLKNCVRAQDMVSRLGGDEFTVILEEITDSRDAALLAQKIIQSVTDPIQLDGQEVVISTSVGISIYPEDAVNAADLTKAGDAAMYRAKNRGRHTFEFYVAELTEQARLRLTTESHLRQALAQNELVLHYQPQVEIATGRLIGVEALLRWRHPDMGLLLPEHFIQVAEESKLISQIGDWVFAKACEQTKIWQSTLAQRFRIAINLSLRQLIYDHTVDNIKNTLAKCDMKSDDVFIELEITESALMSGDLVRQSLNQLRAMGITVAIDDFGTGYSSLSHLRYLPIDSLKIDRAFLRNVPDDINNRAIAIAIISMGHSLGLRVIAEGVETIEQLNFLAEHGCDEAQGFLFSDAVDPSEIEKLLVQGTEFPFILYSAAKNPVNMRK